MRTCLQPCDRELSRQESARRFTADSQCRTVGKPFRPFFAKVLCKALDKTLTLAAASRVTTKILPRPWQTGLGTAQARPFFMTRHFIPNPTVISKGGSLKIFLLHLLLTIQIN